MVLLSLPFLTDIFVHWSPCPEYSHQLVVVLWLDSRGDPKTVGTIDKFSLAK
jgi:hypothetical protein